MSDRDYFEELKKALDGMVACLWFGLPPCPLCGGDHGDSKATADRDADLRRQVDESRAETEKP